MLGVYLFIFGLAGASGFIVFKYATARRELPAWERLRTRSDRLVSSLEQYFHRVTTRIDKSAAHRVLLAVSQEAVAAVLWFSREIDRRMTVLLDKTRQKRAALKKEPSAYLKDVRQHKDSLGPIESPEL